MEGNRLCGRSSCHGATTITPISYAECINPEVDPKIAAAIEPELPALAEEIVAAIQREVPEYARPLRGEFGRGIRAGVEQAGVGHYGIFNGRKWRQSIYPAWAEFIRKVA